MSEVPLYRDGPASDENRSHLCRLRMSLISVQSGGAYVVAVSVVIKVSHVLGRLGPRRMQSMVLLLLLYYSQA